MLWDINLSQSTPEQTIFQHFHEGQHCVLSTDHKQNIQSIFKPGAQVFLYIRPDFSEDFSTPYKTFHGSQGSWATQLHILPQHGCLLYQFLSISKLIELPFKITCLFSLPSCSRATLFSWLKKKTHNTFFQLPGWSDSLLMYKTLFLCQYCLQLDYLSPTRLLMGLCTTVLFQPWLWSLINHTAQSSQDRGLLFHLTFPCIY